MPPIGLLACKTTYVALRANNLPYPPEKLDAIFDMKVRVCACILEDEGGN